MQLQKIPRRPSVHLMLNHRKETRAHVSHKTNQFEGNQVLIQFKMHTIAYRQI